jgi:hypothetical protein
MRKEKSKKIISLINCSDKSNKGNYMLEVCKACSDSSACNQPCSAAEYEQIAINNSKDQLKHRGIKASDINVNQGSTVGEILDNLVDSGNMELRNYRSIGEFGKFNVVVFTEGTNFIINW